MTSHVGDNNSKLAEIARGNWDQHMVKLFRASVYFDIWPR